MLETIITSSVIIVVLFLFRRVLGFRVSAKLQYALWLLVAIRLLIPLPLLSSPISIMNLENTRVFEQTAQTIVSAMQAPDSARSGSDQLISEDGVQSSTENNFRPSEPKPNTAKSPISFSRANLKSSVLFVWLAGMTATAAWFAASNFLLYLKLKKERVEVSVPIAECRIYRTALLSSPCLFGLFCPSVYLTDNVMKDSEASEYVLLHELTHLKHLDHIWSLVRGICVSIYWFNPLVWAAAYMSRTDCELACDESVIDKIGESRRFSYGHTLIYMASPCSQSSMLSAASTMAGRSGISGRIKHIAYGKKSILVSAVAVAVAALLLSCTFTSASQSSDIQFWTDPCQFYDVFVNSDNSASLACEPESEVVAVQSGTVATTEVGCVTIKHENSIISAYDGLADIKVQIGDRVSAGQEIGSVGNMKLHGLAGISFTVSKDGKAQNPFNYIAPFRLFRFDTTGSSFVTDLNCIVEAVSYNGADYRDIKSCAAELKKQLEGNDYQPVGLVPNKILSTEWHSGMNLSVFDNPKHVKIYTDSMLTTDLLTTAAPVPYYGDTMPEAPCVYMLDTAINEYFSLSDYSVFAGTKNESETFFIDMEWQNGNRIIAAIKVFNPQLSQ
ncbi:MAG: M23/M56 family metallopeptidase [Oscillospiraceae bacterium]